MGDAIIKKSFAAYIADEVDEQSPHHQPSGTHHQEDQHECRQRRKRQHVIAYGCLAAINEAEVVDDQGTELFSLRGANRCRAKDVNRAVRRG